MRAPQEPGSWATLSGYRLWIDEVQILRPESVTWAQYQAMSLDVRKAYDHRRLLWLTSVFRVNTPELLLAQQRLERRLLTNALKNTGEGGILITSDVPYSGKTTILRALARQTENRQRKEDPDYRRHGIVPVVFIDAASNASGKGLLERIYAFLSPLPAAAGTTTDQYLRLVVNLLRHHHVRILIIDEAHLVASRRDAHGDPTDIIKLIQNQSRTTVVLAGVNMLSEAVFGTSRGLQVTARADTITIRRPSLTSSQGVKQYIDFLATVDDALPLIEHTPGVLTSHYRQVYDVTRGILGNLIRLVEDLTMDILSDPNRPHEHVTPRRLSSALETGAAISGTPILRPSPSRVGWSRKESRT